MFLLKYVGWGTFSGGTSPVYLGVSFRIQSECGKIRTRKTQNNDTFHAVIIANIFLILADMF